MWTCWRSFIPGRCVSPAGAISCMEELGEILGHKVDSCTHLRPWLQPLVQKQALPIYDESHFMSSSTQVRAVSVCPEQQPLGQVCQFGTVGQPASISNVNGPRGPGGRKRPKRAVFRGAEDPLCTRQARDTYEIGTSQVRAWGRLRLLES
jgi:hypothetical protein